MPLPGQLQQYMTSREYDQATLIQARYDLLKQTEADDIKFYEANPGLFTKEAKDKFVENMGKKNNARACLGGACQCLAIKWIKFKMKEQEEGLTGNRKVLPDDRIDRLRVDARLDKALARHAAARTKQLHTWVFEQAMQLYHVTARNGWNTQQGLKDVAGRVMAKGHRYFVVGIKIHIPKEGGHAIGIYTSGGKAFGAHKHAYVFDPNYGEMAFPLEQFGELFGVLVGSYGTLETDVLCFAQFDPT